MMRKRVNLSLALLFLIAAVLVPIGAPSRTPKSAPPDPLSPGPFPVGVTTAVLIDAKRTDNFTKQPRTLVTEIWYPASNEARRMPKNKYSDFITGGVTPEIDELITRTYKMNAAQMDKT